MIAGLICLGLGFLFIILEHLEQVEYNKRLGKEIVVASNIISIKILSLPDIDLTKLFSGLDLKYNLEQLNEMVQSKEWIMVYFFDKHHSQNQARSLMELVSELDKHKVTFEIKKNGDKIEKDKLIEFLSKQAI